MKKIFSAMTDKLSNILLIDAQEVAKQTRHKQVEPVDILIALLQDPTSEGTKKLSRFFPQGISKVLKIANSLLEETFRESQKKDDQRSRNIKSKKISKGMRKTIEECLTFSKKKSFYLPLSNKSKRLIEKAYLSSKKQGDDYLGTSHIFMVCISSKELYNRLSSKILLRDWRKCLINSPKFKSDLNNFIEIKNKNSLGNFVMDISLQAKSGNLDPILGRDKEMNILISYLGRKKKNNILLLGEPGVGKTALVEGLAQRILLPGMPSWIRQKRILSLDVAGLIAGTRYRGDFEERFKNVMKEIEKDPTTIIFIDEIHMIMGTGSGENGSIDIANMLKPLLARSDIQFIGATTISEYKIHMERDKALTRRFQNLILGEPSEKECLYILKNLLPIYEKFHGLSYTEEALELTIKISQSCLKSKKLPDKAIDILDIASAQKKMNHHPDSIVKEEDIKRTLDIILQISPFFKSYNLLGISERFNSLKEQLNQKVFGQESLIDSLIQKLIHSTLMGSNKGARPFLSCLLAGEHGSGKTHLPKVLADLLWKKSLNQYFTFNMADFSEDSSIFQLVGPLLGHLGYREGGLLTEIAKNNPSSILVFENIDQAHASVLRMLTQILKIGEIIDNKGQIVSFRYNLLFFTFTNKIKGKSNSIGFSEEISDENNQQFLKKDFQRYLSSEFLENVDILSYMIPLSPKKTGNLIESKLSKIQRELALKGVILEIKEKAYLQLGKNWEKRKSEFSSLDNFLYNSFENPLTQIILKSSNISPLKINARVVHNSLKFDIIASI